jgi:Na+/phosphate symporter
MNIDHEILRLESTLKLHEDAFSQRSSAIYDRIENLEQKLDLKITNGRRHAIMTKIDFYENELSKLHEAIGILTNNINSKIQSLRDMKEKRQESEKQKKESIDYNLEYLRNAIERRDTSEIYSMFESIVNSIDIIKKQLQ